MGSVGIKRAAWAIYLEGTRGASVFHNTISGSPSPILDATQNRLKYGVIAKKAGSYWDGVLQRCNVINNTINNTQSGVQTENINLGLTVNCNNLSRNTYAMTVNPATGYMAAFSPIIRNQNEGCGTIFSRPNNSFSNNANGIYSWITNPSSYLRYYVNSSGPGAFIPSGKWGGVTIIPCSGLGNTDANLGCNRTPRIFRDGTLLNSTISAFSAAKAADPTSDETWYQYGEVIRGYTQLDNLQGLKSFLLSDNTDVSKLQLLPIYLSEGNYQSVTSTINSLSADNNEKAAYNSYFNILIALKQSGRSLMQLTQNEQGTMQSLASGEFHIAYAAKSILEWGYEIAWEHLPEEPAQARPGSEAQTVDQIINKSSMGDAAPNPVSDITRIPVWILPYDAAQGCYLVVRNIMGKEMASYQLKEGEGSVSVNTNAWPPGIYVYSMLIDSKPVTTKKFSKLQ